MEKETFYPMSINHVLDIKNITYRVFFLTGTPLKSYSMENLG